MNVGVGHVLEKYSLNTQRPASLKDLPPYRPVVRKLMQVTARENVPLSRLQEILRTDAAFTADVLRLANSPLIGMRNVVSSVLHAVMILGLERIKGLAATLALRSFLTPGGMNDAMRECWRHNLATAIICEKLARFVKIDSDIAYTAGLLHDIGRLALLRASPEMYAGLVATNRDPATLLDAEQSLFEIDHCEAGRWILEEWEFPLELCDVVYRHHTRPDARTPDLCRVVYVGWQIADQLGFSATGCPVKQELQAIVSFLPGDAGAKLLQKYDGLAEEVAFKINAVECSLL